MAGVTGLVCRSGGPRGRGPRPRLARDTRFYYPGPRQRPPLGNPTVRVALSALGTSALVARAELGVQVTVGGTTYPLPGTTATGAVITRFGLWPTSAAMVLRAESAGRWADFPSPGSKQLPPMSPASFSNRTRGVVFACASVTDHLAVTAARSRLGARRAPRCPSSTPHRWIPSARRRSVRGPVLLAPSRTGRTGGRSADLHGTQAPGRPGSTHDICDSTMCQVYSGVGVETTATSAAVTSTSG